MILVRRFASGEDSFDSKLDSCRPPGGRGEHQSDSSAFPVCGAAVLSLCSILLKTGRLKRSLERKCSAYF